MGEPFISDVTDPRHPEWKGVFNNMPNPTDADLADPVFEAIWQTIKSWDVNVPDCYAGYCGANGSHVMLILNAIRAAAKWLEVTDSDPPQDVFVLCANPGYLPFVAKREAHKWYSNDFSKMHPPTLFMYLPEVPASTAGDSRGS